MRLFKRVELEATIIATGDTATQIGIHLIREFKTYDVKLRSMTLLASPKPQINTKIFDKVVYLSQQDYGYAKDFDLARKHVRAKREVIIKELKGIVKKKVDLFIIIASSGATSSTGALEIARILKDEFQITPTVFYLLPSLHENSRSLFNAAMFLDEALYNEKTSLRLPVILTDNKPYTNEENLPLIPVLKQKQALIPTALSDLLASAIIDPLSPEFDAKLIDLLATLNRPGLSVFLSQDLGSTIEGKSINRISAVIVDYVKQITQLSNEDIFEAKSMYIAVFDLDFDFQTIFEARKLKSSFKNTKPTIKYVKSTENPRPRVRAVISDLSLSPRIIRIMQLARDQRKAIIKKEIMAQGELLTFNPKKVIELQQKLEQSWAQSM